MFHRSNKKLHFSIVINIANLIIIVTLTNDDYGPKILADSINLKQKREIRNFYANNAMDR